MIKYIILIIVLSLVNNCTGIREKPRGVLTRLKNKILPRADFELVDSKNYVQCSLGLVKTSNNVQQAYSSYLVNQLMSEDSEIKWDEFLKEIKTTLENSIVNSKGLLRNRKKRQNAKMPSIDVFKNLGNGLSTNTFTNVIEKAKSQGVELQRLCKLTAYNFDYLVDSIQNQVELHQKRLAVTSIGKTIFETSLSAATGGLATSVLKPLVSVTTGFLSTFSSNKDAKLTFHLNIMASFVSKIQQKLLDAEKCDEALTSVYKTLLRFLYGIHHTSRMQPINKLCVDDVIANAKSKDKTFVKLMRMTDLLKHLNSGELSGVDKQPKQKRYTGAISNAIKVGGGKIIAANKDKNNFF